MFNGVGEKKRPLVSAVCSLAVIFRIPIFNLSCVFSDALSEEPGLRRKRNKGSSEDKTVQIILQEVEVSKRGLIFFFFKCYSPSTRWPYTQVFEKLITSSVQIQNTTTSPLSV